MSLGGGRWVSGDDEERAGIEEFCELRLFEVVFVILLGTIGGGILCKVLMLFFSGTFCDFTCFWWLTVCLWCHKDDLDTNVLEHGVQGNLIKTFDEFKNSHFKLWYQINFKHFIDEVVSCSDNDWIGWIWLVSNFGEVRMLEGSTIIEVWSYLTGSYLTEFEPIPRLLECKDIMLNVRKNLIA